MKPTTSPLGMNKTGIDMSPLDSPSMVEESEQQSLRAPGGREDMQEMREDYIKEADPIGSVALPGSFKGIATTILQKLKGDEPALLLDKLGERLAFERTGVRMYELFLTKCEANAGEAAMLPLEQLRKFQEDEATHFALLTSALEALGADPTSLTPAADAAGVMSQGLLQVLADPRTTLSQSLDALLNVELIDNNAWDALIQLAEKADLDEWVAKFRIAQTQEAEHLQVLKNLQLNLLATALAS